VVDSGKPAPAYPESRLDSDDLAPVREALTHILAAHQPYPAIVIDRYGDIVAANAAQRLLTEGCAEHVLGNAYRMALHPDGMAPRIANFAEWARHVLHGIEAALAPSRWANIHASTGAVAGPGSVVRRFRSMATWCTVHPLRITSASLTCG
jgi:hypothetical protein